MANSELISLRVPTELLAKIKKAAKADNRTVSNYLVNLISLALEKNKRPE